MCDLLNFQRISKSVRNDWVRFTFAQKSADAPLGVFGPNPGFLKITGTIHHLYINGQKIFCRNNYVENLTLWWTESSLITIPVGCNIQLELTLYKEEEVFKKHLFAKKKRLLKVEPLIKPEITPTYFLASQSIHGTHQFQSKIRTSQHYLKDIFEYIKGNFRENLQISDMAHKYLIGQHHLTRVIKKHYGFPPLTIVRLMRCFFAVSALVLKTQKSVDLANDLGFYDQPHFTKFFKLTFGITPKELLSKVTVEFDEQNSTLETFTAENVRQISVV